MYLVEEELATSVRLEELDEKVELVVLDKEVLNDVLFQAEFHLHSSVGESNIDVGRLFSTDAPLGRAVGEGDESN